ncbi:1,2-phenylacetyl-CoA epoxidase subunit PaaC [Saccharopolyspora griseoalba]|uniref:1,2-phenylacetyl-CoA epoxidase subunit PaaC n=1 Tax=Saccharopolyspora griseoalba TaxID=1431848 RepID=A0ABW2LIK7_9PSEU
MNIPRSPSGAQTQQWVLGAPNTSAADRSVPDGVDAADLSAYSMMLGDDALVLAHRLGQWGARAGLEEAAALGGIALELLGQARVLLARSGELEAAGRDEDRLAYFRDAEEFRNVRLAEIDCGPGAGGDFAATVARLLLLATWRLAVYQGLAGTRDGVLATLAARSLPAMLDHRDHAAQWAIKFGDSAASADRMAAALGRIWPLTGELFVPHPVEARLADQGCAVDPARVRGDVGRSLDEVFSVARLPDPGEFAEFERPGGRDGAHTAGMPFLLAELQHLARGTGERPRGAAVPRQQETGRSAR